MSGRTNVTAISRLTIGSQQTWIPDAQLDASQATFHLRNQTAASDSAAISDNELSVTSLSGQGGSNSSGAVLTYRSGNTVYEFFPSDTSVI